MEVERLEEILSALPQDNFPMTLSALDGYVIGILCCPDLIPPSEWLAQVWGETDDAGFPDLPPAETAISAVMAHYTAVTLKITKTHTIRPIYEVDPESGERLWEEWIDGFTRAMRLRPEAWNAVLDKGNDETRSALVFLMALKDIDKGASTIPREEIDGIGVQATALIPDCVAAILTASRPELVMGAGSLSRPPG
jgi:uncharacterized protein